jgi:hypothetical protein
MSGGYELTDCVERVFFGQNDKQGTLVDVVEYQLAIDGIQRQFGNDPDPSAVTKKFAEWLKGKTGREFSDAMAWKTIHLVSMLFANAKKNFDVELKSLDSTPASTPTT